VIEVHANITGIQELEMVMLQGLGPDAQSRILTEALAAGGHIVESQVRENAPDRTGDLQASIHTIVKKTAPGQAKVVISTGDRLDGGRFYATFEEYGWHLGKRQRSKGAAKANNARPFIMPAHIHYMERALTMTVSAVEAVTEAIIVKRVQEALS
jgi:hypothetical protein